MSDDQVAALRRAADYQFGAGAGDALFPAGEDGRRITTTSSGRPRQVTADEGRLCTYTVHGRFTLGVAGGRRLHGATDSPTLRVVVGSESEPFVREGRNTFAKFVQRADPAIRPGDEVLVVHDDGRLLAVGRAELAGPDMPAFATGVAVSVREGVPADDADGDGTADDADRDGTADDGD